MRFLIVAAMVLLVSAFPARAFETAARAAILMDYRTGEVLFAKNPDEALPPASMSKLMTAYVAFEEIEKGTLSLDDTLPVSEKAWRMGGSRMFVEVGTRVRVEDLLYGMIVQSGNDACIVLAEALSGSEGAFADKMNRRAAELGLTNSHFANVTGWPDPEHVMSVRDLATLARLIIQRFPQFYGIYSTREFEYNDIRQQNRNPLLRAGVPGVDGMKTGYTSDAGYGLVASAEREGRRLIMVVAGLESSGQRRSESERLLEYGFRNFQEYMLFDVDQPVVEVPVWLGEQDRVQLIGAEPIGVTLTREARDGLEAKVVVETPVPAPVTKGQVLGRIEITAPGLTKRELPLVAAADVPQAGMLGRMTSALSYLIWGGAL